MLKVTFILTARHNAAPLVIVRQKMQNIMAEKDHVLEQLMKCVVRIEAESENGEVAIGTGFAYRFAVKNDGLHIPAIVTNKHVVEGSVRISIPVSMLDAQGDKAGSFEKVTITLSGDNVILHPDQNVDLCAILYASIFSSFKARELYPYIYHLEKRPVISKNYFQDLLPLKEVTMIGFPIGIWDDSNNWAIARRGIIATIPGNNYLGKKEFVIDMACFPGSSGSPVFLIESGYVVSRTYSFTTTGVSSVLLGILYAGPMYTANGEIQVVPVPTKSKPITATSIPVNLGYVIKSTELDAIEQIAEQLMTDETMQRFTHRGSLILKR
ncbi:trypsin-like peptidase domain-containing protein [Desulfobulbus sp. F4]|nr:trypsin-like peptidase domain-containing protein [Desulfobulbus sp. F4]